MKIILISHGSYSKGLYESLEMIFGKQEKISYLGLYPEQNVDDFEKELEDEINKREDNEEILLLSDLFYGSPFNAAVRLMGKYDLYHITGINLPLLMEIALKKNNGMCASQICDEIIEQSKEIVCDVRKKLMDA